jgi:hypothetical protein
MNVTLCPSVNFKVVTAERPDNTSEMGTVEVSVNEDDEPLCPLEVKSRSSSSTSGKGTSSMDASTTNRKSRLSDSEENSTYMTIPKMAVIHLVV